MAYTAPKTWAYKESLSSSDMNTYIRDNFIALIDRFYPVGTVYTNYSNATNPGTLLGFGTWVAIAGRVIVGLDAAQTEFDTAGETGGEKTHLLTGAESGEKGHNHIQDPHGHDLKMGSSDVTVGSAESSDATSGVTQKSGIIYSATATNQAVAASNAASAHNNLQPYVVCYVWRRTA